MLGTRASCLCNKHAWFPGGGPVAQAIFRKSAEGGVTTYLPPGDGGVCRKLEQCACFGAHLAKGAPSNGLSWPAHQAFLTSHWTLKIPQGVGRRLACSRWLTSFLKQPSLAEFPGLSDHTLGHPLGQETTLAHELIYRNKPFFPR